MAKLNYSYLKDQKQRTREQNNYSSFAPAWRMPFGLFKNQPLAAIPTEYLSKIRRHVRNTSILERIANEIDRRARMIHPT